MITQSMIYWITRLDTAVSIFVGISVLAGVCLFASIIGFIACRVLEDEKDFPIKWIARTRHYLIFAISFAIFACGGQLLIPTTNQAVAIYTIPIIANNEDIQEMPANTAKFLNEKLKDWIESTLKEKTTE